MVLDPNERKVLESLDEILNQKSILSSLVPLIDKTFDEFKQSGVTSLTKNIPLEIFGDKLPGEINLCRLFILKANTKSKIERHTNSFQRTFTYSGEGDTKVFLNGTWKSETRKSTENSIEDRWLSVSENIWHEPKALNTNWITITFHTAKENEITDEYMV